MAAVQMVDLLKRGERFHHDLAAYYNELSQEVERAEVAQVLQYMRRHEEFLEHCFLEYEVDAPNAWFRDAPDVPLQKLIEAAEVQPDMTVNQVLQLALQLDNALINAYRRLVDNTVSPKLKESLTALLEMEEQEERRLVMGLREE